MTPHPQPKEYIITMARIIKARNMLMADGYHNADVLDRMVNLLRSRSHTPAARTHTEHGNCLVICQHCGKVTQVQCNDPATIRNQTLEEIEDKCVTYPSDLGDMILLSDVQSLRHQSTEAPK